MTNRTDSKRILRISSSAAVIGTAWLLLPLRIKQPEMDQIVEIILLWIVLVSFGVSTACLPVRKGLRAVGSIPFFLGAAIYPLLMLLSMVAGGPIVGYEVLDSIELRHSKVVAYRLNGGATTDYAIKVSQELTVFPGVVVARDLHTGDHEYTASLKALPRSVVATINGVPTEYSLRSFIYF